jgi:ABC-type polysaccharide/polyol phosphate export permease
VDYNPLAFLVEAYRNLILEGKLPDMTTLLLFTLLSATLAVAGLALFMRLKKHLVELV